MHQARITFNNLMLNVAARRHTLDIALLPHQPNGNKCNNSKLRSILRNQARAAVLPLCKHYGAVRAVRLSKNASSALTMDLATLDCHCDLLINLASEALLK